MSSYHGRSLASLTAVLSFLPCLPLLPLLYLKRENLPLTTLIGCVWISTFVRFLNAVIWPNPEPPFSYNGRGLCDIEVKLSIGLAMAVPGAILCIYRQIALVTDPARIGIQPSFTQRRWNKIIEASFCLVIPSLRMITVHFVQSGRYWIIGVTGCRPVIASSWPKYPLVVVWPVLVGCITIFWTALATWRLAKHLNEIIELLGDSPTAKVKKAKLIKIYVLTSVWFFTITPFNFYLFWKDIESDKKSGVLKPYSWTKIHPSDWAERTRQYPTSISDLVPLFGSTAFTLITAAYFSATCESREFYARIWKKVSPRQRKVKVAVQQTTKAYPTLAPHTSEHETEYDGHPGFELPVW